MFWLVKELTGIALIVAYLLLTLDELDGEARMHSCQPASEPGNGSSVQRARSLINRYLLGCCSCSICYPISWTHRNVEVVWKNRLNYCCYCCCPRWLTAPPPSTYRALRSLSFIKPAKIAWKWLIVRGTWCLARPHAERKGRNLRLSRSGWMVGCALRQSYLHWAIGKLVLGCIFDRA